jgi:hypothetical protein
MSGYLDYVDVASGADASFSIKLIVSAESVTDVDGNVCQAAKIGNHVWTITNLGPDVTSCSASAGTS